MRCTRGTTLSPCGTTTVTKPLRAGIRARGSTATCGCTRSPTCAWTVTERSSPRPASCPTAPGWRSKRRCATTGPIRWSARSSARFSRLRAERSPCGAVWFRWPGKAVSPSVSRRGCTILSCGIRRLRSSIPCVRGSETAAAGRTFMKRPSASAMWKCHPRRG